MPFSLRNYENIVRISRIAAVAAPSLAVFYSLALALAAIYIDASIPVGSFQGYSILFLPLLLVIAFIGWKWDFLGGILSLALGACIFLMIQQAVGWPWWYKIPYLIFWVMYIAGGTLSLFGFFLRKTVK